jgi:hypothetical protein
MNFTVELVSSPRIAAAFSDASATGRSDPHLADAERQPCEVWTRVMGYHRPVASFNTGKQAEHAERRFFNASPCVRS